MKQKKKEIFSLHVKCSIKNTIISLVTPNQCVLKQWSTKSLKKTELKKNNPYNIQLIINRINRTLFIKKIRHLNIFLKGYGIARYYIVKNLNRKIKISNIINKNTIPFNGCRQKKKKRR